MGLTGRAKGEREPRADGDFEFLTNAEYSFPLVGKTLRGVTFLDMGTVEDNFGPITLSFDLAFPIAKDSDDDTQVFSFSFGTTF